MIKTILVPATASDADNAVFASALAVARPFSAHITFLHVRVDAVAMAVTMASEGGGSTMIGGLIDRLEAEAEAREQRARALLDSFCARERLELVATPPGPAGPSAQWTRQVGAEPLWIGEHGRAADLMVIGRSVDGDGVPPETIEIALLESGRPLLVPPASGMTGLPETIVIAWKATREAAHAVTAALPFLSMAKRARILTVAEEGDLSSEEGRELMTNLRWRGIEVSAERTRARSAQSRGYADQRRCGEQRPVGDGRLWSFSAARMGFWRVHEPRAADRSTYPGPDRALTRRRASAQSFGLGRCRFRPRAAQPFVPQADERRPEPPGNCRGTLAGSRRRDVRLQGVFVGTWPVVRTLTEVKAR